MSRIDDALRRLTGGVSPEPKSPQSLDRFASEGEVVSHKVDESRRQARIEARKLTPVVVPTPTPAAAEQRPVPVAPAPTVEAAVQRAVERAVARVEPDGEVDKLVDVRQITDYAGFVLRSVARHKLLTAATFAGVVLLTVAAAMIFPKTYRVEVKLLAQRNAVMTALSNPGRAVPWDADAPTRAAAETVLRRDNLISLVTQTDLINEWDRRRPAIMRFKEWLVSLVTRHELTASDKLDALVWRLETYMQVTAGPIGDGTVTIELRWPDAEMAYRIVERARQSFLEARQAAETSAISESIAILERHSDSLNDVVNKTLGEMARTQPARGTSTARAATAPRPRRTPLAAALDPLTSAVSLTPDAPAPNPELARIRVQLSEKQDELTKVETGRQQQLSEAQATLSALLTTLTPSHPTVQNAQAKLAALQKESPQVAMLKAQVDELEIKYDAMYTADSERIEKETARLRAAAPTRAPVASAPLDPDPVVQEEPAPSLRQNQAAAFADLRLRTELGQLQSILERTDGARIELAVSEAAFKYRYTVIKPAEIPREPDSPNLRLLAIIGLAAAIALSIGAAVGKDLFSNRIVEVWQVERQLGLPILGHVRIG